MAAESSNLEQHFILRVANPELAAKLRGWLRDQASIEDRVSLLFNGAHPAQGVLEVDGQQHEVLLQDLPTVVESYKTLDDANLVKVADIGQVLLVLDPMQPPPTSLESPDGVTPPMRKARARHFKPQVTLPEPLMREAVSDVVEMLGGRAPEGYTFHDVEEEFVADPTTGEGRWAPVRPTKAPREPAGGGAGGGSARAARGAKRRGGGGDSGEDELEDDGLTDSE